MSELSQKLHYKLNGTTDEITLYSTLGEVNNKGLNVKVDGINAYAGYGTEADGEVSRMNYKPPAEEAQKVLKQAGEPVILNLLGYCCNEELLQALPVTRVRKGSYVRFYNENAPTISGYDFVCAYPNCFIADEDQTVKLYYIPQSVPDRNEILWSNTFATATGDLSLQDFANTFNAMVMSNLFENSTITKPPKLNTSQVTALNNMFYRARELQEAKLYYDTTNVINMDSMFRYCNALTNIDLSGFDTSNVTNMNYMFQSCNMLETVDLSNFDTSKVTKMRGMFYLCRNLKKIDISNFDTSKVTDFSYFFKSCSNLTTINCIFDLTSCRYFSNVFVNSNIKGLHLKNVPRSLDLSNCGGTEGETYIIDNYID